MLRSIVLLSALLVAGCNCHDPGDCGDPPSHHGDGRRGMRAPEDRSDRCTGIDHPDAAVADAAIADATPVGPSDATSVQTRPSAAGVPRWSGLEIHHLRA